MIVYCKYGGHNVDTNKVEVDYAGEEIGPDLLPFPVYICEDCIEELEAIEDELAEEQHPSEVEKQQVYTLFYQKLAAKHPDSPWLKEP